MRTEIVFGACSAVTPDFAAHLAQEASLFSSKVYLEQGTTRLCVDSLIGILAMNLRKGMRVTLEVDGEDEAQAMERICLLMQGEK